MLPWEWWDDSRLDLAAVVPDLAPSRLWNVLDSTVSADPCPCDDFTKSDRMSQVIPWSPTPRYVSRVFDERGVVPVKVLGTVRVLTPCVYHKNRWGTRRLTTSERASVLNVPILVQEAALRLGEEGERVLERLTQGHTGKVLHLGTDHSLSSCCRGGCESSVKNI